MMTRRARARRIHPLVAICIVYSLLALAHNAATPVFEAPDEVWHYAYARWIAEGNGLPPLTSDLSGANQEAAQPPLYYVLAALLSRPFNDDDLPHILERHNPGFGYQAPTTSMDNKNMLIHPQSQAIRWHGTVLVVHMTRLASWLYGLVAVCASWALVAEVFDDRRWALVGASLIAFQPQFAFMGGVVNNDSAAAAVAALVLWLGIKILHNDVTWRYTLAAGVVSGIASLTKTSLLPAIPYLTVCLAVSAFVQQSDNRVRRTVSHLALFASTATLLGGWWYLRNLINVGDLLGLRHHTATLWGRPEPITLIELLPELPVLFRSFWGAYGWGHVTWPDAVYILLGLLTFPILVATIINIVENWITFPWRYANRNATHHGALGLECLLSSPLLAATLCAIWLTGITIALLRWMLLVEAPHGRLLFPALPAWAVLHVMGFRRVQALQINRGSRPSRLPHLTLAAMVTTAALAPGARILTTFALPRLQTVDQVLANCSQPQTLDYHTDSSAGSVTFSLLCVETIPNRTKPGGTVTVKACWTTDRTIAEDYTVFVHLLGPENIRVAERHTYPGLGRYPTSLWEPEQAFCDTYTLPVAEWTETPARYWLEIGLFDADSGNRLSTETEPPIIGAVAVVSDDHSQPSETIATLGGATDGPILLTSYDVPAQASPGDTVTITLHWCATSAPLQDYVAFVHLWNPGDPTPLSQHDAQPRNSWYPTSWWQQGDCLADTHELALPGNLAPGTYPLWAGLYDPADGTRMPAYAETRITHDLIPLGKITIISPPE